MNWTDERKRQFFYLLTNDELFWYCTPSEQFFIAKDFMEKKMPKVWEDYLDLLHNMNNFNPDSNSDFPYTFGFNNQLTLDNLLTYLLQPEVVKEWGWVECEYCKADAIYDPINNPTRCPKCGGTERVKHPAPLFAEGKEER